MESSSNAALKAEVISAVFDTVMKKVDEDLDAIRDAIKIELSDGIADEFEEAKSDLVNVIENNKDDLEGEIEDIHDELEEIRKLLKEAKRKLEDLCQTPPPSSESTTTPPAVVSPVSPAGSHLYATAMDAFCEATTAVLLNLYSNAQALKKRLLG